MALSATLEWDIRTTGNNLNGGAFRRGATGADYSLQDAPQITFTDLVIGGTNTQLTSAANPFTAAHVGNVINVTSGTGFTTGRYEVISVAGATATMDRAVGTAASTGGNARLGGAMQTLAGVLPTPAVHLNIIWMKTGTYSVSTGVTTASGGSTSIRITGYQTTHGDNGTKPLLTTATSSVIYLLVQGGNTRVLARNLRFTNTAASNRFSSITIQTAAEFEAYDCEFDGPVQAIYSNEITRPLLLVRCKFSNCSAAGVEAPSNIQMINCRVTNCGTGVKVNAVSGISDGACRLSRNVLVNNTGPGVSGGTAARLILEGNTIANNTGAGIVTTGVSLTLINNLVYGNTTWGLDAVNVSDSMQANNAFGSNPSGSRSTGTPPGDNDVTLIVNPFTNSASGDYSLNNTAGGGALCRGAGLQWGS